MACDGSRRLWILDFARARSRSSHSNTGVSYLLYILTTGKISLSHFEVTDPDGICCQPDIFTGCQIGLAPNCPFYYLGVKMFVCFLGAKLSTFTILVPFCPGAKLSFNLSLSLYSKSCDIHLQPRMLGALGAC